MIIIQTTYNDNVFKIRKNNNFCKVNAESCGYK